MDSFAIFHVAQTGMNRQQNNLMSLATRMASMPVSNTGTLGVGLSQHLEETMQEAQKVTLDQPVSTPSYLTTVTTMMDSMRLYQMNATVASAARSMIERSLDISGK